MSINGDSYKVTYHDGIIRISGKLSIMPEEYDKIGLFFKKAVESETSEITLDIMNLEYLNSCGIKTLCIGLILEAADKENFRIKILCSDRYTWQRETIPSFHDLADNLEIVFITSK